MTVRLVKKPAWAPAPVVYLGGHSLLARARPWLIALAIVLVLAVNTVLGMVWFARWDAALESAHLQGMLVGSTMCGGGQ
ncbi:hypothetical protein ACO2Q9_02735 [Variovorax sp. VNK109]|uniref:hypothetical protein n=1 Tax=Variovorax sp. VNK109 TaxID=3400919 RepID=UPI003C0C8C36